MTNIFDTITKGLPKATNEDIAKLNSLKRTPGTPAVLNISSTSTEDLIKEWKKDTGNSAYSEELLNRMKPTITSALSSYAKGNEQSLKIKAARYTLDALSKYDPSLGASPATFVFSSLKKLSRDNQSRSGIMALSEYNQYLSASLNKAEADFEDMHGREASDSELADITGISEKKINSIRNQNVIINESSTMVEDDNGSMKDTFTQSGVSDNDYLEYVYSEVDPVSQKILEWSSGLHGKPLLSGNDMAKRLGISPAAVAQRKSRLSQLLETYRTLI